MDESFGAGGFDTSNFGGGGVQSETRAEGVAPLLIKQVINMPEKGVELFGMKFGIVSLVAIVRAIDHSSTKITYTLEDQTGRIDAHLWLEEGDSMMSPSLLLNTYARVFGSIRTQGGGKTIMIFKIEPLESLNGLTTHLLEVLNTRFKAEDIANNGVRVSTVKADNGNGVQQQQAVDNGLQGKEKLIFDAVKGYTGEHGISVQELQGKFSNIAASELIRITDFLSQEGHIYTSIDSDHFLSTDA